LAAKGDHTSVDRDHEARSSHTLQTLGDRGLDVAKRGVPVPELRFELVLRPAVGIATSTAWPKTSPIYHLQTRAPQRTARSLAHLKPCCSPP